MSSNQTAAVCVALIPVNLAIGLHTTVGNLAWWFAAAGFIAASVGVAIQLPETVKRVTRRHGRGERQP